MIAWYRINKNYIASQLCVNKYRPQLHCDGKCFLAQKLKQAEQNEKENAPAALKQWVESTPFTVTATGFEWTTPSPANVYQTAVADTYFFLRLHAIFRPPGSC